MISYAVSTGSMTGIITPELAAAFRRSKLKNVELDFSYVDVAPEAYALSEKLAADLLAEDVIRTASVHLPSYGFGSWWDVSSLDEEKRKIAVKSHCELLKKRKGLLGPLATLHASGEPPLEEHPRRIDQVCRSLEEMIPTAQSLGVCIDVEFLPRTCVGHNVEELQLITSRFDPAQVGICFDVNHVMDKYRELPDMITALAPRIRAFHICDYNGQDETHWFAGQGVIDWIAVMKAIRAIDHDVSLISETWYELGDYYGRPQDPWFSLKQAEDAIWFLEHCEDVMPSQKAFRIPGND